MSFVLQTAVTWLSVVDVGFVAADMCATYSTHANVVLEKKICLSNP
jgi:hypothetical protein